MLFTTNTQRTHATLAPLAATTGLVPRRYDAQRLQALVDTLRRAHAGQAVVVVGHSNTLLLLIPALGPPLPVPEIGDDEDSCLFKVRVPARCLAIARVRLRVVLIAKALATGAQAVLIGTFGQLHDFLPYFFFDAPPFLLAPDRPAGR